MTKPLFDLFNTSSLRRTKIEIDYNVLKTIRDGETKPSRIMNMNFLQWKQINILFERFENNGLIKAVTTPHKKNPNKIRKTYFITDKGIKAIELIEEAQGILATNETA
jgi:predicted transcriptional regulator